MLRKLLIALTALAASACSYGSAVDMAPMAQRSDKALLANGDYCEIAELAPPYVVTSSEDCAPIRFDKATRTYLMRQEPEDDADEVPASVVSLGNGLYLAQTQVDSDKAKYQMLLLANAGGDAFAMLRILDDAELKALIPRHPKLNFAEDGKRPYVASGKPDDIKAWLRDIARKALSTKPEPTDPFYSISVLDKAGQKDHAASKKQADDIRKLMRTLDGIKK